MSPYVSQLLGRVPAPLLFVVGGGSLYLGAALAVALFRELPPAAVAWLRLLGAAVVLVVWRRPPMAAWRGRRMLLAGSFGVVTGLMNAAFYQAIDRLPLGTAVAVEFCGPVAVAALSSRTARDWAALVLAGLGVGLIADVRWTGGAPGVLWAVAAASLWGGYIVLAKRVAQGGNGVDDLAVGFTVAAVLLVPLAAGSAEVWTRGGRLVGLGVGVGVLSSVLPYVLDQVVLRRVGRARFAVLLALLPVTATVIGLVALAQVPGWAELVGIAAVVVAVALRSRDGDPPPEVAPSGPSEGSGRAG
jgi:inner membrane transporter RhtA